jgi:hypothetical protein
MSSILEILRDLEARGICVYLRGEEIRVRGRVSPELLPLLRQIAEQQDEARAVLELWGVPADLAEDRRVRKAFTIPKTFLVYDDRTGRVRWIC